MKASSNEYKRAWKRKNIEKVRESGRRYMQRKRAENPEAARAASQRWREKNPEAARLSRNASMRRWAAANPELHAARSRDSHLKSKYGISSAAYDAMLVAQGGGCAICQAPQNPSRRHAVDHDHSTGKVRGLLCLRCNVTVGVLEKRKDLLTKAAAYLAKRA